MDFATLRKSMVDNQLRTNEVFDHQILGAMLQLPRERFVAPSFKSMAYSDHAAPLPGTDDRKMMPPVAAARLVQLADGHSGDVALVVGCGTGYTSALLAQLVDSVVALDEDESLVGFAADILSNLHIENVATVQGSLESGLSAEGPYDIILIEGAVDYVPAELMDQMRDGGKLIAVEGSGLSAPANLYRKSGGEVSCTPAFNLSIPRLPGFTRKAEFVF